MRAAIVMHARPVIVVQAAKSTCLSSTQGLSTADWLILNTRIGYVADAEEESAIVVQR